MFCQGRERGMGKREPKGVCTCLGEQRHERNQIAKPRFLFLEFSFHLVVGILCSRLRETTLWIVVLEM